MSYDDLIDITKYTEKETGYSHMIRRMPDFTCNSEGELIKGIYFNGDDDKKWDGSLYKDYINTNVFSFFINLKYSQILYNGIQSLLDDLPVSELYNLIIFSDVILNENKLYKGNLYKLPFFYF